MKEYKYEDYIKTILISMGGMIVLYFYMLCNFWWGNHDWGYLLSGASIESGLFEARYSQHLFTILVLDGHILPVLFFLMGFLCISGIGICVGKYLEIDSKYWWVIALFIGANPHIFALFYYVYLIFPFFVWSLVGVLGLLWLEGKVRWYKIVGGVLLYAFVLGSYPPNLAFIFVLFVVKRLFMYEDGKEDFKSLVIRFALLGGVFVGAGLIYKCGYAYLIKNNMVNLDMYNIQTKSLSDIIKNIPYEIKMSVLQLFTFFSFMKIKYVLLLSLLVGVGVFVVFKDARNSLITLCLVVALFVSSRFAFLLSSNSQFAVFRLMYWGRMALYIAFWAVLMRKKDIWVKNFLFFMVVSVLSLFVVRNFEVQKVQNMGFVAGRLFQKRLLDTLIFNKDFNEKGDYISLSFGQPNFREKFYKDDINTGEMLGLNMVFEFDVVNFLFWEEEKSPVIIGAGISGPGILRVDRDAGEKWKNASYWLNNPSNMENIKFWLYTKAKPYPSYDSVYVDDKYLLLVLDRLTFDKNKELVARKLDSY